MSNNLTVRDLYNYFNYRQVYGDANSLNRPISEPNTNRPGLELSGYLDDHVNKRVVVIGEKESNYIKTMSETNQRMVFDYLTNDQIPCIIICRDLPCPPILAEIAYKKNFPVFSSYAPTNSIVAEIISFLEERFAEKKSYHGGLLQVYGRGVLIQGQSGIGKSEIALELIKKGHILVADDRVDICRVHNEIRGEAPEILRGLLELRGIGIINIEQMYGVSAVNDSSTIDYVVYLQRWEDDDEFDRLNSSEEQLTEDFFGIELPKIIIPVTGGRSIAAIIEAAITNQILKSRGINASQELENRTIYLINKNKKGA